MCVCVFVRACVRACVCACVHVCVVCVCECFVKIRFDFYAKTAYVVNCDQFMQHLRHLYCLLNIIALVAVVPVTVMNVIIISSNISHRRRSTIRRSGVNYKTTDIPLAEDTSNLTIDWPELQQNTIRFPVGSDHRNGPESTEYPQSSEKPRNSVLDQPQQDPKMLRRATILAKSPRKASGAMMPRRITFRVDSEARRYNRAFSYTSKNPPLVDQTRQGGRIAKDPRHVISSALAEEASKLDSVNEKEMMGHQDSTFHHADRRLMSSQTSLKTPLSQDNLNSGSDLSLALSEEEQKWVRR